MGLKPRFTTKDIEKALNQDLKKIENGILSIMQRAGEEFVSDARQGVNISGAFPKGDYTDQTANLRNSIGYFILVDNDLVAESGGGGIGHMAAKRVLNELPAGSGYRLIGVAGMEYASYLESKGYNVISSQQFQLIIDLSDKLKKYSKRWGKKGVNLDFAQEFTGPSSKLNL